MTRPGLRAAGDHPRGFCLADAASECRPCSRSPHPAFGERKRNKRPRADRALIAESKPGCPSHHRPRRCAAGERSNPCAANGRPSPRRCELKRRSVNTRPHDQSRWFLDRRSIRFSPHDPPRVHHDTGRTARFPNDGRSQMSISPWTAPGRRHTTETPFTALHEQRRRARTCDAHDGDRPGTRALDVVAVLFTLRPGSPYQTRARGSRPSTWRRPSSSTPMATTWTLVDQGTSRSAHLRLQPRCVAVRRRPCLSGPARTRARAANQSTSGAIDLG